MPRSSASRTAARDSAGGFVRESRVAGIRVALEVRRGVLEITEQTAGVAGRGDVVVEVGDERHLVADDLGAPAVGRLEHELLAPLVDARRLGARREQLDGVVDGQPVAVAGRRERVLERLLRDGAVVEVELVVTVHAVDSRPRE